MSNQSKFNDLWNWVRYINGPTFKAHIFNGGSAAEVKARKSFIGEFFDYETELEGERHKGTTTLRKKIAWMAENFDNIFFFLRDTLLPEVKATRTEIKTLRETQDRILELLTPEADDKEKP